MSEPSFVAVGNALIDHTYRLTNFPAVDGGAYVRNYERHLAGVETNVATLVESLGHDAGVVACVGRDEDGDEVIDRLGSLPVSARVSRHPAAKTSYCLVLVDPSGRRAIIGGGESTLELTLDAGDRAMLASAAVAFTSAYAPASVAAAVAEHAPTLVYDLAGEFADLRHRGLTRADVDALIPDIDCMIGNVRAVRSYLEQGGDPATLASELRDAGIDRGAITSGPDGAYVFDQDGGVAVEAYPVSVADATGAGDAFTAGFIHALYFESLDLEGAGRFAAAAAAINCTRRGPTARPPSVADVETFLAEQDGR